ncbi:hypothetical protein LTS18_013445 [Coniosporium uncinatum]|uniref:Uncharacterized protein n=1 Tax=Coniosporium uncinatum TaxID=93489 RepID=A0ACC3DIB5_9PEZI|nr:hypothetical protein LTS18_013445 [Coniosporium uncinatum]
MYMPNPSSWEATNEGKPLPQAIGHADMFHGYYQQTVHPSMADPRIQDIRLTRMEHPGMAFSPPPGQSLLGLPGAQHHELFQVHSRTGTPVTQHGQVDPMLLAYDNGNYIDPNGLLHHGSVGLGHPMQHQIDPYLEGAPMEYHSDDWQADASVEPMETGSEFAKWMEETSEN